MNHKRLTFAMRLTRAVALFWQSREMSAAKQQQKGQATEGNRGAVIGGKTMDSFRDMIAEVAHRCGPPGTIVHREKSMVILPGFFRPTKQWDLLIEHRGRLLAALELKSLCGPSFGNNANNRCEEALGSGYDLRKSQSEGMLGDGAAPFIGYFILIEDAEKSRKPVKISSPHFPTDAVFQDASYQERMRLLCERMIQQQLYTAAAVLATPTRSVTGEHGDLSKLTSFRRHLTQLASALSAESDLASADGMVEEAQMSFGDRSKQSWDSFDDYPAENVS